jgi:hypothetical protein
MPLYVKIRGNRLFRCTLKKLPNSSHALIDAERPAMAHDVVRPSSAFWGASAIEPNLP